MLHIMKIASRAGIFTCMTLVGACPGLRAMDAEPAPSASQKMSFNRACNRLAMDVPAPRDTKTIPPRASPEQPLLQPPYPPPARSRKEEGTVVMELFVSEIGEVVEARVARSSGYEDLDAAALRGVENWRLIPGTFGGTPVCMWGRFAVTFSLAVDQSKQRVPAFIGVGLSEHGV